MRSPIETEPPEESQAASKSTSKIDSTQQVAVPKLNDMMKYLEVDAKALDRHSESQIATFYDGRCIFITGASGFVGKCLLEKLLRSCPDLERVYILMRSKRGVTVSDRVEILKQSELFDKLRNLPDGQEQLNKITPVEGDITQPNFGLSEEDVDLLSRRVSIVFHSAATVKFVEPLNVAVGNNVVSVENLVHLCSRLSRLEALVHVSTAYSNCDRKQVDEVFYDTPIDANKLIDMAKWMKPEMLDKISPILLGNRPNTYTYTKAVAESLLVENSKTMLPNVPIAMVRPSIVAGTWRQPICGWVDNFNGPTGVILSMMSGAIQAMLACPNYCADIVPVDIVANLLICAAWQVHNQHKKPGLRLQERSIDQNENISVFNCVSGTLNPLFWKLVSERLEYVGKRFPMNNLMRKPGFLLISNERIFRAFNFVNHTTVAYTGDLFLKLIGKKPTLVVIYQRLMRMVNTLKPFTTSQWLFKCKNVTRLYERLSPIDKELFNFDVRQVAWSDYLDSYYIGSKVYAMKDDPDTLATARYKLERLNNGSRVVQFMLLLLAYYFLLSGTASEKYVVHLLANLFAFDSSVLGEISGITTGAATRT